ncbi:MAG: DUF4369 domain-containing protein [Bacteroides sp.]
MKKILVLFAFILSLSACQNSIKDATIQGEIKGLTNDTIYLFGTDGGYERIDTILVKDGKFNHALKVDTLSSAMLLFGDKTQVPVFLDKAITVSLQGRADALPFLTITGSTANEEYTAFQQEIKGIAKPSDKVLEKKAENFIHTHRSSLVSVYLLNHYFIQKAAPDYAKISTLIALMVGNLQDNQLIDPIKTQLEEAEKAGTSKTAAYFTLTNTKGQFITWTELFKDKYLLIHFWASWDEPSIQANAELRKINRSYKKNKNFGMLGISLDIDKAAWKKVVKRDTLDWEQVCDFTGFQSETIHQYGIVNLPANVLIKPDGKIVAWNVKEEDLKRYITK